MAKQRRTRFTAEDIARYRRDPVLACKELLKINLVWYQRICLRSMFKYRFVVLLMARGAGKTFLLGIYLVLYAMLYPGSRCGSMSRTIEQACFPLRKIEEEIYNDEERGAILRQELSRKPSISEKSGCLVFRNGSIVLASVIKRGRRFNVVVLDEYAEIDRKRVDTIIKPMLNVKRKIGRDTESDNRIIYSSTATYKWNHFYELVCQFRELKKGNSPLHDILEFDIDDALEAGVIDPVMVEEQRRDTPEIVFRMEHYNEFPDETIGFIRHLWLEDAARREPYEVEMFGDPNYEYIMGVDVARVEGGDNFAIAIIKIMPRGKRRLVRIFTANGIPFQQMRDAIRYFMDIYNIVAIYMDSGGGGQAVRDLLTDPVQLSPETGEKLLPVFEAGTKDLRGDQEGLYILRLVDPSPKTNHEIALLFKKDLQQGDLLFPQVAVHDLDPELEHANLEIKLAKTEISSVQAKPSGNYFKFELPRGDTKLRKDRWSAVILANYGVEQYLNGDSAEELGIGGWV